MATVKNDTIFSSGYDHCIVWKLPDLLSSKRCWPLGSSGGSVSLSNNILAWVALNLRSSIRKSILYKFEVKLSVL